MDQQEKSRPPTKEDVISVARESRCRFLWWDYPIFAALTTAHLTVFGFVLYQWITDIDRYQANLIFLILVGSVLLQFILWEWRWLALPLMRMPQQIPAAPGWRVAVAVTFVPRAESIEMLEKTVKAIIEIDYPHDTWVLDEGDDAESAISAKDMVRGISHAGTFFDTKRKAARSSPRQSTATIMRG